MNNHAIHTYRFSKRVVEGVLGMLFHDGALSIEGQDLKCFQ
jgi:hypothetical protein